MTEKTLICIVTVTLDAAAYIEKALLSVLNQWYTNIELVVIDGGSSDGTLDVFERYREQIDYLVSEPDRGLYHASAYEPPRRAATARGTGAPKRAMKRPRSSSQEATEDSGRLSIQARGTPARAMGNQLAMTLSSPPATQTASSYAWRNAAGSATPS
jgi:cellulose synthase/poly-beta-1,6-N-acetylglucosamine synthase-like glycosyltransferase